VTIPYSIIIPARYASTRLPGKPLLKIKGKPLIQQVYEQARLSDARAIYIATDDERVRKSAKKFNANVVMTSDKHESGTDRLAEVIEKEFIAHDEIIVNVQGDEYGLPNILIEQVAELLHAHPDAKVATLCEPIEKEEDYLNPNIVKVVKDKQNRALYFSRSPIPHNRDDGLLKQCFRHIGLYAYRAGYLSQFTKMPISALEKNEKLEQLRVLENGDRIIIDVARAKSGIGIDTKEDLALVIKQV